MGKRIHANYGRVMIACVAVATAQGCRAITDSPLPVNELGQRQIETVLAAAAPPGTWAFGLNGSSDFVSVPYSPAFNGPGLTIEAWVRLSADVV